MEIGKHNGLAKDYLQDMDKILTPSPPINVRKNVSFSDDILKLIYF